MSRIRPTNNTSKIITNEKQELYKKLAVGEAQIKNGEVLIDGDKIFKDIKNRYDEK